MNDLLLFRPVAPTEAWAVNKISPLDPILGHVLQSFPGITERFDVHFQFSVLWLTTSFPLWIPCEGLSGSVVRLFTKCVSNPFPATQLQLFSGRLLVWFVEQFFVGHDLRSADLQDASQAFINEGLYLRNVVNCCSPCFVQKK